MKMRHSITVLTSLLIFSCSSPENENDPTLVQQSTTEYTLTIGSGTGGSVSTSGGTYEEGTTVNITATPNSEYIFQNWSNGSTDNPLTVTVNQNITLTANFIKRKYPLTINIQGEGTVSEEIVSSGKATPTEYNSGTVVRLTAVADDGWRFNEWSGAISGTEETIEVTLSSTKTIIVDFTRLTYSFLESLSNLNKNTSWYQNNQGFNFFVRQMFPYTYDNFNCLKTSTDSSLYLSNECYGANNEYFHETAGYIYHDFNKDGDLDLWHHFMKSPWPQNVNGVDFLSFDIQSSTPTYTLNKSLTQIRTQLLADINNDGNNEIVLFSSGYDGTPAYGDSLGIFLPLQNEYKFFLTNNIGYMHSGALGDIDNDSDMDIVTFYNTCETCQEFVPKVLLNDGRGDFTTSTDIIDMSIEGPIFGNYYTTQLFDINNDGFIDIFYSGTDNTYERNQVVTILYGDQNSRYSYSNSMKINLQETSMELALDIDFYDFNDDGMYDLILNLVGEGYTSSSLEVYINNGEGFDLATNNYFDNYSFQCNNCWMKWLHLKDIDNDGDLDIIADGLYSLGYLGMLYWENIDGFFFQRNDPTIYDSPY